jgi:hypothetical protein
MRQKEFFAQVLWDVGKWEGNLIQRRGNVSIKTERRFGPNLLETIWQNKHEVGVISIRQIINSRCNAIGRNVSIVGMKENSFYFHNGK